MCLVQQKTLQVLQGSAINKILKIPQCTLPPQPIYQTLLSNFLRVWLRDYDLQYYISLISRPFSPPVFDHLQWSKMEGKGPRDLVTCMMSSRLRVDVRGRAVDDCCNSQTLNQSTSSLPNDELCWCCLSKATVSCFWTWYYKDLEIRYQPHPTYHYVTLLGPQSWERQQN